MADYNIYIHSDSSGDSGNSKPTKPKTKDGSKTKAKDDKSDFEGKFVKGLGFLENPDSMISAGMSTVLKAVPYIACAFAVRSLVNTAITTVQSFQVVSTGDYSSYNSWANYKQIVSNVFHPFSTTMNIFRANLQAQVNQQKVNQQISLLGDSVVNSGRTNKGV